MSQVSPRRSVALATRFHADIYTAPDRTIVRAHGELMIIGARPRAYRRFALTRLVDRLDVHPTPAARALTPASTDASPSGLTS